MPQDIHGARRPVGAGLLRQAADRGFQPGPQPEQRAAAEHEKGRLPAEAGHQHATDKRPERRSQRVADRQKAIGPTEAGHRHRRGENLRRAGEGCTFAKAEHQPQKDQHDKAVAHPDQQGRARPERGAGGQHAMRAEALPQPSDGHLRRRVGPVEGRHDQSELLLAQMQVILDQMRGERQCAAVDVVDKEPDRQHHNDAAERPAGRRWQRRRPGVQFA